MMRRCHCPKSAVKALRLDAMAWRINLERIARILRHRSLRACSRSSRVEPTWGSSLRRGGGARNTLPLAHRHRVIRARSALISAGTCFGVRVGGDMVRCRTCLASALRIAGIAWSQDWRAPQSTELRAASHPLKDVKACCSIRERSEGISAVVASIWCVHP